MDISAINQILAKRRKIYLKEKPAEKDSAYYNAYLYANMGIVADKPELIGKEAFLSLVSLYAQTVPQSYLKNPQDIKYYSGDELFIEQVFSYFFKYGEDDCHMKVFDKDLPDYQSGCDLERRSFHVISEDKELNKELDSILDAYGSYSRPWSADEAEEAKTLLKNGFSFESAPNCKDNIIELAISGIHDYDKYLKAKDVVRMSEILLGGDCKNFEYTKEQKNILEETLRRVGGLEKDLTKRQCKYFMTILKKLYGGKPNKYKETLREEATERRIAKLLKAGKPIEAAEICAKDGSKLQRHLAWILSRCKSQDQREKVLSLVDDSNPIALVQLLSSAHLDDDSPRMFSFTKLGLAKSHRETEEEAKKRKSVLSGFVAEIAAKTLYEKVESGLKKMPSLGKAYVSDDFAKVALPINASTSGKGIDVRPQGSRIALRADKVRTFVWWKDAYDIDSSLTLIRYADSGKEISTVDFRDFASRLCGGDVGWGDLKGAVYFSGDCTSQNGAEYYDLDLAKLKALGYKYVIQSFHGYCSKLDEGEIQAGYQKKEDFDSAAWDPKNIAFSMHVKGKSRACNAFAIDLETNEVVILNQMVAHEGQVVCERSTSPAERLLELDLETFNMKKVAECRSEPAGQEEAELILSDEDIELKEGQTQIRSWETEKLAKLLNA